ncbi:hypothetical protein EMCRGX_G031917 [Ephydatia muelleri]
MDDTLRENDAISTSMLQSFVRATTQSRQTAPASRRKMLPSLIKKRREVVAEGANSVNSELSDLGTAEEATPLEEVTGSRQDGELDRLMQRESSWRRACLHKGVRKYTVNGTRDKRCFESRVFCASSRIIRSLGVFGFMGGVIIWIAVEMLFRRIPFLFGSGVLLRQYKSIRETISSIVIETLFDPAALRKYFSGKNKKVREMLRVDTKLGLFNSQIVEVVIDQKISAILAGPDGFVLNMMGVNQDQLRLTMKTHARDFINEISPLVMEKLADPGLTDGVDLHEEAEKILGTKIGQLSSGKVRQLMAVMIRKHLSWLIVWGNILGATFGITIEVVALLLIFFRQLPVINLQ